MQSATDQTVTPFRAFVARAAEGRNSLPRILIGSIIVVALWFGGTFVVLTAGAAAAWAGWIPTIGADATGNAYVDFVATPAGLIATVATLGAIWPGVWLALKLLHKRPISSVLGAGGRLAWGDFRQAALVTLAVAVAVSLLNLAFEPTAQRSSVAVSTWLLTLPIAALVLLVQTSAEEVFFRGYLLQSLAQRFKSWLVWGGLPAAIFAFAHWSGEAQPWMNASVVASILMFAAAAVVLVHLTGNLGAAMGMHFANNLVAFLFMASGKDGQTLALFITPPVDDPRWTTADAAIGLAVQAAMTGLTLYVLAARNSPLRVGKKAPSINAGAAASI
ncbi:MAG: CPBP family intramembrane metalloprotease [Rhizobiaceae bacterium]|nr:CPBP family intramembrane metalloprotease [Rhizobiaceae bacterium]